MNNRTRVKEVIFWAIFFVIFGLVPVFAKSDYHLMLANHILIWGMFAMAFNMLFGVTGMLSFGQALYYGLGAYSVGLIVKGFGEVWFVPAIVVGLLFSRVYLYSDRSFGNPGQWCVFHRAYTGLRSTGLADNVQMVPFHRWR